MIFIYCLLSWLGAGLLSALIFFYFEWYKGWLDIAFSKDELWNTLYFYFLYHTPLGFISLIVTIIVIYEDLTQ